MNRTLETVETGDEALEIVRFEGLRPGPRLIVLGAVHGNEPCGPGAIARAMAEIRASRLVIRRGHITFVPVANPKAYRQRTREGDRNLNRDLRERTHPEDLEGRIGNRLCALLREHDVLLDLHSFTGPGEPFVFAGPGDNRGEVEPFAQAGAEWEFAIRLGTSVVIHGWLDGYACFLAERKRLGFPAGAISEGVGTTEYTRFAGGYGVTIECGSHDDPASIEVAYGAIRRALAHLGLIDAPVPEVSARTAIRIVDSLLCGAEGDRLEGRRVTGEAVAAGEVIARRSSGEALTAPRAGFLVFPDPRPEPGKQLCSFGVASNRRIEA